MVTICGGERVIMSLYCISYDCVVLFVRPLYNVYTMYTMYMYMYMLLYMYIELFSTSKTVVCVCVCVCVCVTVPLSSTLAKCISISVVCPSFEG